jgi:hypothetical protein
VIDTLMAAPIAQRAAVVGVIRFAQHARLTFEDLVYAVDQLERGGDGVADHIDGVVKEFRRGMRDSNAELRRRQIRSVPGKKNGPR